VYEAAASAVLRLCLLQVILPLALTIVKQQQEIDALSTPKPGIKSSAAAAVAGRDPTPPECIDMIPKGVPVPLVQESGTVPAYSAWGMPSDTAALADGSCES
jgi:hypothetical protein